jgi:uncharacterized Fe-S radical SAM superfamily protein PflX
MNPNLPLIDDVMHHIDTHPEQHGQSYWFCGTTACVAGHVALLSGWRPVFKAPCELAFCDCQTFTSQVEKDGERRRVSDLAQDLLQIDADTADRLFYGGNTVDDLHQVVKELHGAPHQPLSWEPSEDSESAA